LDWIASLSYHPNLRTCWIVAHFCKIQYH
jgi:hypothetical protein